MKLEQAHALDFCRVTWTETVYRLVWYVNLLLYHFNYNLQYVWLGYLGQTPIGLASACPHPF